MGSTEENSRSLLSQSIVTATILTADSTIISVYTQVNQAETEASGSISSTTTPKASTSPLTVCHVDSEKNVCLGSGDGESVVSTSTLSTATNSTVSSPTLTSFGGSSNSSLAKSTSSTFTSLADPTAVNAPSQSSPSSSGPSQTGLGIATVAGAAVGCFVAGAFFAGFLVFCLFRKRLQRDEQISRSTYVPAANHNNGKEKGAPIVSISSVSSFDFLPQQADDTDIRRRLSTVIDQINQHVENFYVDKSVSLDDNLAADISRFETSQLSQPLATCFAYGSSPTTLIKHCLTFHIFNLTIAPGRGTQPLLPTELAGMVAAVYNRTLSTNTSKDTLTAFSTWKTLTRYLRPDLIRDAATSRSTTDNSVRIASQFTNVFQPWSNAQFTSDHRNRHLTELVNNAVQTAVWLFGQADNFKCDWDSPLVGQNLRDSVVIVPAIWKLTFDGTRLDGNGQRIMASVVKQFYYN